MHEKKCYEGKSIIIELFLFIIILLQKIGMFSYFYPLFF